MLTLALLLVLGVITYVYVGFPLLLLALQKARAGALRIGWARPRSGELLLPTGIAGDILSDSPPASTVTLLIAAYNEESILAEKIANSAALDYPADRIQIAVVLDGSTDSSEALLRRYPEVAVFFHPERRGKCAALARVMPLLESDIVVLSDANAMYRPDAVRQLIAPFRDPDVAVVSGSKRVVRADGTADGEGVYWRYENRIKQAQSALGSALGGVGEILAVRRARWQAPPHDAIIEDSHVILSAIEQGWRHVFAPDAISEEGPSAGSGDDLERRARIAAGGWQLTVRFAALLNPLRHGWTAIAFLSHRVLRWIVVPPLLIIAAPLLNAAAVHQGAHPLLTVLLAGQLIAMLSALFAPLAERLGRVGRILRVPHFLYLSNFAAILGGLRYLSGRQSVLWQRVQRQGELVAR